METISEKEAGYRVKSYDQPVKRYCQTLDLKDNPELIAEYRKRHSEEQAWPEIIQGIARLASSKWKSIFWATACS